MHFSRAAARVSSGSSVTLAHVSGRPRGVAPTDSRFEMWILQGLPQGQNTPFIAHFGKCQKFAFRSVLPISHKSRAFAGTLRSPQMAPTKRQRSAFCGKEEAPAPKAKVFRRKTEQIRRAPTTSAAIGKMFFLSAYPRTGSSITLAHWMKCHVSGRPHRVAPTDACFEIWILQGLPQNANAVRFVGKRRRRRPRRRFFAGKPSKYAVRRRRPRQSVKCFSTRHSRALGQGSALHTG